MIDMLKGIWTWVRFPYTPLEKSNR